MIRRCRVRWLRNLRATLFFFLIQFTGLEEDKSMNWFGGKMLHICQVQKNPPHHHYEDLRSRKLETCPGLICERELSPHFFDHYIVEDNGDHHFLMVMSQNLWLWYHWHCWGFGEQHWWSRLDQLLWISRGPLPKAKLPIVTFLRKQEKIFY